MAKKKSDRNNRSIKSIRFDEVIIASPRNSVNVKSRILDKSLSTKFSGYKYKYQQDEDDERY